MYWCGSVLCSCSMEHTPFVTDPRHLKSLAESSYLVVRPPHEIADAYLEAQEAVRSLGYGEVPSYPAPHMTLKGFAGRADESVTALVRDWAAETPPLAIGLKRVSSFPDFRVLIVEVERTPELATALEKIRSLCRHLEPSNEDEIPAENWTFHLSLAYASALEESDWDLLQQRASEIEVRGGSRVALDAELVAFDGGPEQLLGRFRLEG